jgi:hypothetical protein
VNVFEDYLQKIVTFAEKHHGQLAEKKNIYIPVRFCFLPLSPNVLLGQNVGISYGLEEVLFWHFAQNYKSQLRRGWTRDGVLEIACSMNSSESQHFWNVF